MCGPKICSMEMTQRARDHAATAANVDMAGMSEEFRKIGNRVYIEAKFDRGWRLRP